MEARWKYHDGRIMPEREYDAFHANDTATSYYQIADPVSDIMNDTGGNTYVRTPKLTKQQLMKILQEALGMIEGG
jgi:hypothetical protein